MKVFLLVFMIAVDSIRGQCKDVSDVKFLLIRGQNTSDLDPVPVPWDSIGSLLNSSYYDNNKMTIVYACGFIESFQTLSVQTVINAYLTRKQEFNIFIIDWSEFSGGNYFLEAVPYSLKVSA